MNWIPSLESSKKELRVIWNLFKTIPNSFSIFLIFIYQNVGSPHLGGCCRFHPSCSEFSLGCYKKFSFLKATRLTFKRVMSCRPGGAFGFDPIPESDGN